MKKILILYTSVGLGHKSIAENIAFNLEGAGFEVRLADILKVQEGRLVSVARSVHGFLNRSLPEVWSFLYKNRWVTNCLLPFRTKVAAGHYQRTWSLINNLNPDLVICTQATASAILAYLKDKGLFKGLFAIAFSDFHLHRFWLYDNCDFYLANIDEQKQMMISLGVEPEKIAVCGMTLKPRTALDSGQIKRRLGIAENQKVVLVGVGSRGPGFEKKLLSDLLKLNDCKIVIVCGKNEKLFQELTTKQLPNNFLVLGYYSPMEELYAIADVFITKPGGLSVTESLSFCLPVIITHRLPGQEELNINYLMEKKLAVIYPKDLVGLVNEELRDGKLRKALEKSVERQKLVSFGKPVVEAVKRLLHVV